MIPKIINCIWFSNDPKDEISQKCRKSWEEKLPDYKIVEWSLKDVEQIRKNSKYLDQALNAKKWSYAADYLRLWILYNYGGIYLDYDVEILKPFSQEMLNCGYFTCYEFNKTIEAAVMGAEKGNEIAKEFLDLYKDKSFIKEDGTLNKEEFIPEILADYLVEEYGIKNYKANKKHSYIKSLHIYPYYYFSPINKYRNKIKITDNTYAIHRFNGAWLTPQETNPHSFIETVRYYLRKNLNYLNYKKACRKLSKIKHLFGK